MVAQAGQLPVVMAVAVEAVLPWSSATELR
jgi:hypothetical protein